MSISIVLLNDGNKEALFECLRSFKNEINDEDELAVIDISGTVNNVPDALLISEERPETTLLNKIIPKLKNNKVLLFDTNCFFDVGFLAKFRPYIKDNRISIARADRYNGPNKPISTDRRIGLAQEPKLCRLYCLSFPKNKAIESGLFDERITDRGYNHGIEFCKRMVENSMMPLEFCPDVKIFIKKPRVNSNMGQYDKVLANPMKIDAEIPKLDNVSIIVPNKQNSKLVNFVKENMDEGDELVIFSLGKSNINSEIEKLVKQARNEKIIIFSPQMNPSDFSLIERMKIEIKNNTIILYDPKMTQYFFRKVNIQNTLGFQKKDFKILDVQFSSYLPYVKNLLESFKEVKVIGEMKDKEEERKEAIKAAERRIQAKRKKNQHGKPVARNVRRKPKAKEIDVKKPASKAVKGKSPYNIINGKPQIIKDRLLSIIIPFQFNGDRWSLFKACIQNIHSIIKSDHRVELCVHEIGPKRHLTNEFLKNNKIKYMFTEWHEPFHRGWALNVGAKKISSGDGLIFLDGDILITKEWVNEIAKVSSPCIAWGKLQDLTKDGTKKYLETGQINPPYGRTRRPSKEGAAGGITFCPRDIFFKVHGFPEMFKGTWGGNDNAFMTKLFIMGYGFSSMKSVVYHLHHSHQQKKVGAIRSKWGEVRQWKQKDWEKYNNNNKWGENPGGLKNEYFLPMSIGVIKPHVSRIGGSIATILSFADAFKELGADVRVYSYKDGKNTIKGRSVQDFYNLKYLKDSDFIWKLREKRFMTESVKKHNLLFTRGLYFTKYGDFPNKFITWVINSKDFKEHGSIADTWTNSVATGSTTCDSRVMIPPHDYSIFREKARKGKRKYDAVMIGRGNDFHQKGLALFAEIVKKYKLRGMLITTLDSEMTKMKIEGLGIPYKANISKEKVAEILGDSKYYILTSRQESCPLVIYEALNAGCYPISRNVGAVAEQLGGHGKLCSNDNQLMNCLDQEPHIDIESLIERGKYFDREYCLPRIFDILRYYV